MLPPLPRKDVEQLRKLLMGKLYGKILGDTMQLGQVPFQIQKFLYDKARGVFGLADRDKTEIAIALDAAILTGALMARRGEGGFEAISEQTMENMIREKLQQVGALNNRPFG